MFLPGPNARVRTLNISKSVIKSVLLSLAGMLVLSVYLIYEYNDVQGKVSELQSMREEIMQQKVQAQSFALNLIDYKRQMYLIRNLDTKLRRAVGLGARDKAQQLLGIGGRDELGLQNLAAIGQKSQGEALEEMHRELTQLQGAASKQETSLQTLIEYFEDRHSLYTSTPMGWPVRGWATSAYGALDRVGAIAAEDAERLALEARGAVGPEYRLAATTTKVSLAELRAADGRDAEAAAHGAYAQLHAKAAAQKQKSRVAA